MHLTLRSSIGKALADLLAHCTLKERKAAITLARSQYLPNPEVDTVLFSKTRPFLQYLVRNPNLIDEPQYDLTELGEAVVSCITSPLLAGLVISLALGQHYTETQLQEERDASFTKELLATQTRRQPSGWNWDYILGNTPHDPKVFYCHLEFPNLSILHLRFRVQLSRMKRRLHTRTVLPHYTKRGISKETALYLLHRRKTRPRYGSTSTFHRQLDPTNVTSRDVVHHYIRTGEWVRGRVEMKQRWYPSGLAPRTYFSWGGVEIQASTYLRDFFNDVADRFEPTERKLRVQPDWLRSQDPEDLFFFYDLTSFTSWFHEQVPFLEALGRYFEGVTFDVVVEGLQLMTVGVSDMIDGYIRWVNDFPRFTISERIVGRDCVYSHIHLAHLTAGFLGVPGNLIMCTLPHGLAMSVGLQDIHHLQVPGDDVGRVVPNVLCMNDAGMQARTLGILQMDKVYNSLEASVYLKRGVRITNGKVTLTDMLIYPLLPLLVHPRNAEQLKYVRSVYRPPDSRDIVPRACSIMVTFIRHLWKLSHGSLSSLEVELIIDLLLAIHRELQVPLGGILQGRYLGSDEISEESFQSVSLKFPIEERYFREDPDRLFANEHVEVYVIRELEERDVTVSVTEDLHVGSFITVQSTKGWKFLEDMGYLRRVQRTAGEPRLLVGQAAKEAYLYFKKPVYSTFRVEEHIFKSNLMALGLAEAYEGAEFSSVELKRTQRMEEDFVVAAWRFRYVDPDRPVVGDVYTLDYDDEEPYYADYPVFDPHFDAVQLDVSSYIEMFK